MFEARFRHTLPGARDSVDEQSVVAGETKIFVDGGTEIIAVDRIIKRGQRRSVYERRPKRHKLDVDTCPSVTWDDRILGTQLAFFNRQVQFTHWHID